MRLRELVRPFSCQRAPSKSISNSFCGRIGRPSGTCKAIVTLGPQEGWREALQGTSGQRFSAVVHKGGSLRFVTVRHFIRFLYSRTLKQPDSFHKATKEQKGRTRTSLTKHWKDWKAKPDTWHNLHSTSWRKERSPLRDRMTTIGER